MNDFSYTNPYSQPAAAAAVNPYAQQPQPPPAQPQTAVQDLLHQLETTASPHQLLSLLQCPQPTALEWNLSTSTRLVDWVLSFFKEAKTKHTNRNQQQQRQQLIPIILRLLAKCLESWDDRLVYAAAVHTTEVSSSSSSSSSDPTLLQWLEDCIGCPADDLPLRQAALSALTSIWESLDRLDQIVVAAPATTSLSSSSSSSWWIPNVSEHASSSGGGSSSTPWVEAIQLALQFGRNDNHNIDDATNTGTTNAHQQLRPEEWKATCASFLVQLLQHGQDDWIFFSCTTEQTLNTLTQAITSEAARLSDPSMPVSSYTKLSLMSLQLLIYLTEARGSSGALPSQQGQQQQQQQHLGGVLRDLFEPLLRASFGVDSGSEGHHRWTTRLHHTSSLPVMQWSQGVLSALCRSSSSQNNSNNSNNNIWKENVATHPLIRKRAQDCWSALLALPKETTSIKEDVFSHLFLLNRLFPQCVRSALQTILQEQCKEKDDEVQRPNADYYRQLPATLLRCVRHQDSVYAAGLLVDLLSHRRRRVLHDEMSRALWEEGIDSKFVLQCIELLVSSRQMRMHSSSSSSAKDYHCPKAICLLDTVLTAVSLDETLRQTTLSLLSADAVESLVTIMCPKQTRLEVGRGCSIGGSDCSLIDAEECTPPAHNLSRLDDTMFAVEEAQLPRGMDAIVRLSAATTLATLAKPFDDKHHEQEEEGRILVLQHRMTQAVHSYLSESNFSIVHGNGGGDSKKNNLSLEMTRRRLRLLTALAADPENEEYLVASLYATETSQRQKMESYRQKLTRCTKDLKESRQKERRLQTDKEASDLRLQQQSARFQREKSDIQRKYAMETKQQVIVHWLERSKAEKAARELSTKYQQAESRLVDAETKAKSAQSAEEQARASLESYTQRVQELESRQGEFRQRAEVSEKELQRVSAELKSTSAAYQKTRAAERDLAESLESREQALEDAEDREVAMRDSLESLFADMVSLAQLYELKEKEVSSAKEHEVGLIDELRRKLKNQAKHTTEIEEQLRQARYENDVLSNKCAKAREKLERERKERQRDVERRKRSNPVSYINQLHQSTVSERSTSKSSRSAREKENDTQTSKRSSKSTKARRDDESQSYRSASSSHRSRSRLY